MKSAITTLPVSRAENGEVLESIVVTHEANGCAIWIARCGWRPRLVSFHLFDASNTRDGTVAATLVHAQRLQKQAEVNGEGFAASRAFTQC